MNYNQKQLVEEFLKFESDHQLIDWNIKNIPIWELIRFRVFHIIQKQLLNKSFIEIQHKSSFINSLKSYVINKSNNPLKHKSTINYLVINHPRRRFIDGFYFDVYTDPFLNELDADFAVMEGYSDFSHFKPTKTKNLYYLDFIDFPNLIISKLSRFIFISKQEKLKLLEIKNKIDQLWGVSNIDILNEAKKNILRHRFLYPKYKKIINKLKPSKIIVLVSYHYNSQIITQIAKEEGISVVELQHGTVGRYHIGYNYPQNIRTKTFPNYFFSWGNFWIKNVRLPIPKENIINVGFPFIDSYKDQENVLKSNVIVILSQGRKDLVELTMFLSTKISNYRFVFKAHPREYGMVRERYPELVNNPNVDIVDNNNIKLYDLFKTSKFVIGINSTAIIESLAFNCGIIIMKYPGWEYFENLEENKNIFFANKNEEVLNYIYMTDFELPDNIESDSFFKQNAKKYLLENIKLI